MLQAEENSGRRPNWRSAWFALATAYVVSVSLLAAIGIASDSNRIPLLVATALTLPCGVVALVGLYVLTGLFNWVAAGFTTYSYSSGGCNSSGHCWSSGTPVGAQGILFDSCIVALYLGAAVTNILFIRERRRRRKTFGITSPRR